MVYISCNKCLHVLILIGAVLIIFSACENFDEDDESDFTHPPETDDQNSLELNRTSEHAGFRRGHSSGRKTTRKVSTRRTTSKYVPHYPTKPPTVTSLKKTTTTRASRFTTPTKITTTTKKSSTKRTTTTRGPRKTTTTTTTTTPKPKWQLSDTKRNLLFGGLAGSALGLYLGSQIGKIQWEADMPAYSVRHYWHQDGVGPLVTDNTEIENKLISKCSSNAFFCLTDTTPMCLTNGKIYCLAKQNQLLPCTNSKVGSCFPATVRVPCGNSFSVQCMFLDYKYEELSIPCLKYMKVKYTVPSNDDDKIFKIPRMVNETINANSTCQCNKTISWTKRVGEVTCVLLPIDNSTQILCSGLNLSNYTFVSMNSTLNSTNAKYISCKESQTFNNNSILNIFNSQKKSLLSRCESVSSTGSIDMMCGYVGNLTNVSASIPFNANVLNLECQTTLTSIFTNLKVINMTASANNTNNSTTCPCSVAKNVTQSGSALTPNVMTRDVFVSTDFCVYMTAFPTKLYTNEEYARYLNRYKDEKKEAANKAHQIMSAIANFIFF